MKIHVILTAPLKTLTSPGQHPRSGRRFRRVFPLDPPEILEDPNAQAALAALAAKLLDIIGDGKSGAQVEAEATMGWVA